MSFREYMLWPDRRGEVHIDEGIVFIGSKWEDYTFIRYESMKVDLQLLCEKLHIPFIEDKLPHEKSGYKESKDNMRYYHEETKAIVARDNSREIAKFGYEF